MSLLETVVEALQANRIRFALIGAAAMAIHGVSRSTFDVDLLATDPRSLTRKSGSGSRPIFVPEMRRTPSPAWCGFA